MKMKGHCPWCAERLSTKLVRSLGNIPTPCPYCGQPIKASTIQVLFVVVCLLPILAVALMLSRSVYGQGQRLVAIAVLLGGMGFSVYVQKYLPLVAGPAKGPRKRGTV